MPQIFSEQFDKIKQIPESLKSQVYLVLYKMLARGSISSDQLEISNHDINDYVESGYLPVSISSNLELRNTLDTLELTLREGNNLRLSRRSAIDNFLQAAIKLKVLIYTREKTYDLEEAQAIIEEVIEPLLSKGNSYRIRGAMRGFRYFQIQVGTFGADRESYQTYFVDVHRRVLFNESLNREI